jgi:hypothetical protein
LLPYPRARKWIFGIAIAINTVLFPVSLLLESNQMAFVNIGSALLCWLGWFRAVDDLETETLNKDKENGR